MYHVRMLCVSNVSLIQKSVLIGCSEKVKTKTVSCYDPLFFIILWVVEMFIIRQSSGNVHYKTVIECSRLSFYYTK